MNIKSFIQNKKAIDIKKSLQIYLKQVAIPQYYIIIEFQSSKYQNSSNSTQTMINPLPTNKKRRKIGESRSEAQLPQSSGSGSPQKLPLKQLLNIDSVLPAPKAAPAGKQDKQKLIKEKYKHLSNVKQVYKTAATPELGHALAGQDRERVAQAEERLVTKQRIEKKQAPSDPFGNLFPRGSLRERSLKQQSRGLARSPQGLFTVEELRILKSKQERMDRERDEEDRFTQKAFKIKKVKMNKGQDIHKMKDNQVHLPILQDEGNPTTGRPEAEDDDDQPQKLGREEERREEQESLPASGRQQVVDGGSRNSAGPAFGNQLLGTALQLPGPAYDYDALCAVHKDDHLQGLLRTSKSAHPKSPKQGSQPLSALSLPPVASQATHSQQAGLTERGADAVKQAITLAQQRAATTVFPRPRLKRFNSLNEVQLDSQASRPLDPDIFVAKKRIDIEMANFQTRQAIEKLGESSRESGPANQRDGSKPPVAAKPSKQHQVQQLLKDIEGNNALRKMKEQDLKKAQLLRLINSLMAEPEDEDGAATAREMDRVKGEIMQLIDQIQSKDTLTSLVQQLLLENGGQSARGAALREETLERADQNQMPLVVKPPLHKAKMSPRAGREKKKEFQHSQNEKMMALIQEFTARERATERDPDRENMTQSRRLLTFLQKNLLFEQNKLDEPVKESKAQIEEEIERDLQYLNVFIQPIQNINIFNKDNDQQIEVRPREAPEEEAAESQKQSEPLTFDGQLKELLLNSPLRPLVDQRILELQRQVETAEASAAKAAFANTFQQQSKINQGPIAASQAPCQTPAYLQMQALSEVLDSVLMCEQDPRGGEAGESAHLGKGAAANISSRDEKMLNPIQQEELRKMKQMKLEIAEQFLPQLLPFVAEGNEPNRLGNGQQDGRGLRSGLGTGRNVNQGSTQPQRHPANGGIDVGQSMLSDHKIVFEMDRIYELQSKLDGLVVDTTSGDRLTKDQAMTFLTEHYPPDKVLSKEQRSQKQADLRSLLWPKSQHHLRPQQKQAIEAAKQASEEEQAKQDLEELKVTDFHLSRRQQLTAILEKIDKSQAAIKRIAEVYTISGSQKQTLLYLCFIECARQIAKHSKTQAMLITKIFHEYFSITQKEIRGLVTEIHRHLQEIAVQTEKLIAAVKKEYHNHLSKDIDTSKLKQDFNKTIEVLEIAVRRLYAEEARRLSAELRLDLFGQNLGLVFPHATEYLLEKNVDDEEYVKEEMQKQEEQRRAGSGESLSLVHVGAAGAREGTERKQADAGATESAEVPKHDSQWDSDRVDIISKSITWNEQVQRFRRRIVKFYRVAGYRLSEAEDALDNRVRPADIEDDAEDGHQFPDGKTRRMHEKMTKGRSWGQPQGGYQVPGAAFAEQQAAADEIYKLVLADVDRLLAVVPIKTDLEKRLDRQKDDYKLLARQYAQLEKARERHEKDLQFLQARCNELTEEIVERQAKYEAKIAQLKKEQEEEVARAADQAKEAAILELRVKTEDVETMTVVDGEAERILRQREFNQKLLQYRGANRHYKEKPTATTKRQEDEFMRGIPPVDHCYLPIATMIRQVRQGKSKYQQGDLKSVKNVLKMVAGLLQAKITAMGKHAQQDNLAMMNIDSFYYHHVQQTYGLDQLANKYCEIYLASIEAHRSKDTRLELFRKFVGLDVEKLPYSIFERYVTMIKATNIPVQNLFTMPLNGVYVEYPRVRYIFRELLSEASDLIHKQVYQQLQSYSKVVSGNPTLGKYLELEEYEVFRDLQDATIRSRFKTNAMMLKSLFIELNIQTEELDSDSEDDRGSSQAPKLVTKRQFVEFLLSNFDLTDYSRGNFNCSPKKTVQRVEAMVDKIFILAQGAVGDAMTPRQMMSAFREKIEVKLPVAAFFHIGINASALHENDENQHYEMVYQFYTQCVVEWDEGTQELVARNVHYRLNMEGMSFDQFMLFLRDTLCPLVADGKRQAAFEIFKATCEGKNRAALLCEDFLEAIRKYRLLPSVEACERAMHDREILVAKELRLAMIMLSEPVPAFVAETAARKLTADVERSTSQGAGRSTLDREGQADDVEVLKREQAEIQKRTVKRREEVKREVHERSALEKAQGLAKLSELTGTRRRTLKTEALAEFLGSSAKGAGKAPSESHSPTKVLSHSSASPFDKAGPALKGRDASGGRFAESLDRSRSNERPPPDGGVVTAGLSPESESPTSGVPEGRVAGKERPQAEQQIEDAPNLANRDGRADESRTGSLPVGAPRAGGNTDEDASNGEAKNGSAASPTQLHRRTVLIKADSLKQPAGLPQHANSTAGGQDQSVDDAGPVHDAQGRLSASPSDQRAPLPKSGPPEPSEDDDDYGSEY